MERDRLKRLVLAAVFLSLGMVLPLLTGQLKEIGDTLLPMHLPVMLCGLICGYGYGGVVGFCLPFLRSLIFGMPPPYPNAVWMAVELATYGFVIGFLYSRKKEHKFWYLMVSLVSSMLAGRVSWGIAKWLLLATKGKAFTLGAFFVGGFVDAVPGIISQLILVPVIVIIYLKITKKQRSGRVKKVLFPYGKEEIEYSFDENELVGVLDSSINTYSPSGTEAELVLEAMKNPIGTKTLAELAVGKKNVVIIASDHTRPVPSKYIIPPMLKEIREGAPDAKITILIATGCHRGTTKDELRAKFGDEIVDNEEIYVHDCDERENLVDIGVLPSGGRCEISKIAKDADLLVAEGFIEPHFFAGYSGGRKSVLPGVCARKTVLANHCSEFIAHEKARTGALNGNPIHEDMIWAAREAKLAYIVNVVLNSKKEVIYAVAGDAFEAHKQGTDFLSSLCGAQAIDADIVITTNGGYPLDQNVYQAVKGMTAAEATVKQGGVIIMLAKSNDGIGGDHFYHQLADEADINKTMNEFLSRGREETVPDQWQTQILLRVLLHASVVYVSDMEPEVIEKMHMTPAKNLGEAIEKAKGIIGTKSPKIVAIPDGVSVIVQK